MKIIQKLSVYSTYNPASGLMADILGMAKAGKSRAEALEVFAAEGRSSDHFRHALKCLKDKMLQESFEKKLAPEVPELKRRRMACWSKYLKVKQLMILEEREAAMELAGEVLLLAERYGFLDIEYGVLGNLEYYYGAVAPDNGRYLRYRKRLRVAAAELHDEQEAMSLISLLAFHFRKKKDWGLLEERIQEIVQKQNDRPTFNLYRYTLATLWYQLRQDHLKLVETCQEALHYFKDRQDDLPYTVKWNFYRKMIPVLVAKGEFDKADYHLGHCIAEPEEGTQNWHLAQLQRAYLGFYSNKPRIAFDAWNRAMKYNKHNNPEIREQWMTVLAYLNIFEKLGQITLEKPLRLSTYLNSLLLTPQEKAGANVAIIIAHVLYLLLDDNKKGYMNRVAGLPDYAHLHLRGDENMRSRCMLHMLAKVEEGDYYKVRTLPRVEHWTRLMRKHPIQMVTEAELIPFEKIWQIVLSRLK